MTTLGKALSDIVSEINRSEGDLLHRIRELTNESDVQINGTPVPPIAFAPDTYLGFDEFRIAFDFEIRSFSSDSSAKHGSG